jgi:hypothetical protein
VARLSWLSFIAAAGISAAVPGAAQTDAARSITVASRYFGNYRPGEPRKNEWTEGSYLEPDVVNGMKYLEAVRDVFGAKP